MNTEQEKTETSDFFDKVKERARGTTCPHCGSVVRQYKRKLNVNMCIALIEVVKWYRHSPLQPDTLDYFHVNDIFPEGSPLLIDFTKLAYWDLIEAKGKEVKGKFIREKGYFRISENGIKFVQREVAIPMTAVVFRSKVIAHILEPYDTIDGILEKSGVSYDEAIRP